MKTSWMRPGPSVKQNGWAVAVQGNVVIVNLEGDQGQRREHEPAALRGEIVAEGRPTANLVGMFVALILQVDEQVAHLRVPVLPVLAAGVVDHLRGIENEVNAEFVFVRKVLRL